MSVIVKAEAAAAGLLGAGVMAYGVIAETAREETTEPTLAATSSPIDFPRVGDAGVQVPALYVAVGSVVVLSTFAMHILWRSNKQNIEVQSAMNKVVTENSVSTAIAVEKCSEAAKACADALEKCAGESKAK